MDKNKKNPMRFTEGELRLIKDTFKDNEPLLKLIRKVFLPTFDYDAPIGQTVDLWADIDLARIPEAQWPIHIIARGKLIHHLDLHLMELGILANMPEETKEEKAKRQEKDSAR